MNTFSYLIIGDGRLSRHLQHYFSLLNLSYVVWSRKQELDELHVLIPNATHILILIPDSHIENFIASHLMQTETVLIHCSGSLVTDKAYGVHPLQTFNNDLYDLVTYQNIAFVMDDDAPAFSLLMPGLNNPHARLAKTLKAKYHALCVASGNFSCILWQTFFDKMLHEFQLPDSFAKKYLQQQTKNLINDYKSALTGPLVRQDKNTLEKNLQSLQNDPLQKIYSAFIDYYAEIKL